MTSKTHKIGGKKAMFVDNFINFNDFINMSIQYDIEIKIGNQITQKLSLPIPIAKQQFAQTVKEISNIAQPIEIKCSYSDYTDDNKEIKNSLTFQNNSFIRFEEESKNV
jgi:hypothetical protein